MDLTQAHLDRLVCPVCHGPLRLVQVDSPANDSAAARAIDCTACRRRYPFHDGLPVLIAARATEPSPRQNIE
jgi:uncharacterized protein YbaR (Trm112 family)